ncbi:MAG: transposase [Thermoleophilia bacterium]
MVVTDVAESYRHALGERLAQATRVADPFHVVRIGNRCLDQVRRRVQNQTLGHRGRKADPLYRIRKLLAKSVEHLDQAGLDRMLLQLRVGDPEDEVMGAWLAKESVRDIYLTSDPADAETLIDKAIQGCKADPVAEIRALGRTLGRWRTEILAHHTTGASNGPTEALNLLIKKVKRAGHGFRNFTNYRLLLHAGGVNWISRPPRRHHSGNPDHAETRGAGNDRGFRFRHPAGLEEARGRLQVALAPSGACLAPSARQLLVVALKQGWQCRRARPSQARTQCPLHIESIRKIEDAASRRVAAVETASSFRRAPLEGSWPDPSWP